MRNASTRLPEQGTQTPSPAPDLIPAKTKQELTLGLVQRTGARQEDEKTIAIGGGWLVLRFTGSLNWLFAALTLALVVYGIVITAAEGSVGIHTS